MQQNKELDYETIYNGRGREIQKIIIEFFGSEKIKLIAEKPELPDRPERDNKVALMLTFLLDDKVEFTCAIGMGMGFTIKEVNGQKRIVSEVDYMTYELYEYLDFRLDDEVVLRKLNIFSKTIEEVLNGNLVTKVGVDEAN